MYMYMYMCIYLSGNLFSFLIPFVFRSLFGGMSSLIVSEDDPLVITSVQSAEGEELQLAQTVSQNNACADYMYSVHVHVCSIYRKKFRNQVGLY